MHLKAHCSRASSSCLLGRSRGVPLAVPTPRATSPRLHVCKAPRYKENPQDQDKAKSPAPDGSLPTAAVPPETAAAYQAAIGGMPSTIPTAPGAPLHTPSPVTPPPPAAAATPPTRTSDVAATQAVANIQTSAGPPVPGPQTPALPFVRVGSAAGVMYEGLAWAGFALMLATVAAPSAVAKTLLKTDVTSVGESLLRLAAATMLPTLLTKHYLKEACVSGMAGSRLPYQLNMAVMVHSGLSLLVLAQAVSLRNPLLIVLGGSLLAGSTLVSVYVANRVRPIHKLVTGVRGIGAAALSLVTPVTWRAAVYSAACVGLLVAGGLLLRTSPEAPSLLLGQATSALITVPSTVTAATGSDVLTVFTSRMAGAGLLSAGILSLGLKEVADAQLLDATIPRALNAGLALMSVASSAILGLALAGGSAAPAHSVTWLLLGGVTLAAWTALNAFQPPTNSTNVPPPIPAMAVLGRQANGVAPSLADTEDAVFLRQLAAQQLMGGSF